MEINVPGHIWRKLGDLPVQVLHHHVFGLGFEQGVECTEVGDAGVAQQVDQRDAIDSLGATKIR